MPPHRSARAQLTRDWLAKADEDLQAARFLAAAPTVLHDSVAFHCQQAAEKALKAYLTWHSLPFRRTHDLAELLLQCTAIDPSVQPLSAAANVLVQYAIDPRYPGPASGVGPLASADALTLAGQVVREVLARLPPAVHP